ncbi:MAG: ABC transporter substrate-binding protein [Chitinophagaceae bacterium]
MMRIRMIRLALQLLLLAVIVMSCNSNAVKDTNDDPVKLSWDALLKEAKGQTVNMMMWQGDPQINKYMNDYIVPAIKEKYGIYLQISAGQGNQIVSILMSEKEAKKTASDIDMCWINGETFYQLRQIDGLYGPFVNKLPNAVYIDFENPFIKYDFQEPVAGMECPWGNVQLCIIYNKGKVPAPPKNRAELAAYVQQNPGRFTIGVDFTGLTFLKSLLIDIAGGSKNLMGKFDEAKYATYSQQLWEYINSIKAYFWKQGKTFPNAVAQMHQMFASGELYFTMSNNDGEVDNKVAEKIFPEFARSYVLDGGTIQNSHYLGITKTSGHKTAAMVIINFMISPEAQLEKNKSAVWGDGTVLDIAKLPDTFKSIFAGLQERKYGPRRADIQSKALMELAPEYMTRLNDDFRKHVIEQ